MYVPMPQGVHLSPDIPDWGKLSIADALIVFGRMEQKIIETSWVLEDANLKRKLKLARTLATENFLAILEIIEQQEHGLKLDAIKGVFNPEDPCYRRGTRTMRRPRASGGDG